MAKYSLLSLSMMAALTSGLMAPVPSALANTHVEIDLSDQRARVFRDGRILISSPISTGKSGYETPTGSFNIKEKDIDHRSNLYGEYIDGAGRVAKWNVDVRKHAAPAGTSFRGARMDYFMRVNGGVGMHDGPIPGYPASHGCIRLPRPAARYIFSQVSVGTPVTIRP